MSKVWVVMGDGFEHTGGMARDHRKLKVFGTAHDLVIQVHRVTKKFPGEEVFGLTSQMRRAAVSAPANIVEGCSRDSESEYLHFLDIAKGSLQELGYYLDLSRDLGYLAVQEHELLTGKFSTCIRQLQALVNALRRR